MTDGMLNAVMLAILLLAVACLAFVLAAHARYAYRSSVRDSEPLDMRPVIGYWYDPTSTAAQFFRSLAIAPSDETPRCIRLAVGSIVPGIYGKDWGEIRGNPPTEAS